VDAVLLAPVCPFCHQAAGLLQSIIEKAGIATVSISLLLDITRRVEPPRALAVDRPLGYPFGEAHNPDLQRTILLAALGLLSISVSGPLIQPASA
jgi:D-proline reductase (dithiol) PrdB